MNRENTIQPFPGRKITLFYLPNGNIRIVWKHPENTPLERIIISIISIPGFIYWGYITQPAIRPPIEIISDFIRYQLESFNIISFLFGLLSLFVVLVFFSCCLCFLFYGGIRILLNLLVYVKGTGESKLYLNENELVYQEGQYPVLINYSKYKVLFAENIDLSKDISINEAVNILRKNILDLRFIIFSKPTITFSKQEIQNIQIETVEERLKLFIVVNNQKIAVGKYLYNSEKEWLYQIMTQWLNF